MSEQFNEGGEVGYLIPVCVNVNCLPASVRNSEYSEMICPIAKSLHKFFLLDAITQWNWDLYILSISNAQMNSKTLDKWLSPQWHRQARRRKRRIRKGEALARTFGKRSAVFDPHSPLRFIGDDHSSNGLSRAYKYEIAKWANVYQSTPPPNRAVQTLILAQPWDYPRLLAEPPEWFRDAYRIGLWVWELDQFPSDWRFALDIVHEIWTPSTFSAAALRHGTDLPIRVVPHAVVNPTESPLPRSRFGVRDDQFLGMAIMDLAACPDRKNPVAHARAWARAFGNDSDVHLLMKVRFKKATEFARNALVKEISGAKNITLIEEDFTDSDMSGFQRMADVYLSLHRAEGYGLNIHEMLELGIPTIATGWSGNMDFMPKYPIAFPVPFTMVPCKDRTFAYVGENLSWAEPDINVASEFLRAIQNNWRNNKRGNL